jgi:hypothetical protein
MQRSTKADTSKQRKSSSPFGMPKISFESHHNSSEATSGLRLFLRVRKYFFDRKNDRNQIVIFPISLQCMTAHTLKIRELKEELFDNLDPYHCKQSKMDAYTFKKLEKRSIEKRCSLLIFTNGRAK